MANTTISPAMLEALKRIQEEKARKQEAYKPTPFVAEAEKKSRDNFPKTEEEWRRKAPKIFPEQMRQKESAYYDSLGTSFYTHQLLDKIKQGVPAKVALESLSGQMTQPEMGGIADYGKMSDMQKKVAPVSTKIVVDKFGQKVAVPIYAQPKVYPTNTYQIKEHPKGFWEKITDTTTDIDRKYIDPIREGMTPNFVKPKLEETRKTISKFIDKWNPFADTPPPPRKSTINNQGKLINNQPITPAMSVVLKKIQEDKAKKNIAPPRNNGNTRPDGTKKGKGFLGEIKRPDGKVSTELSIGVNIDGKEVLIPTMVPSLTKEEITHLTSGKYNPQARKGIDDVISRKAIDFARQRAAKKQPFFATPEEEGKFKIEATPVPEPLAPRMPSTQIIDSSQPISTPEPVTVTQPAQPVLKEVIQAQKPVIRKGPKAIMPRRQGGWSNQPLLMRMFPKLYAK
jgi:hypothetical protein